MEEENVQTYLIPANAKKSTLILGLFTIPDIIVFGIGITFTVGMLLTISTNDLLTMILIIIPSLVSGLMVCPVRYYHNVMQLLINIYSFFFEQRRYKWKGWCVLDEQNKDE